jgi:hypothetical protein
MHEFIRQVAELSADDQNRFFDGIRSIVTAQELQALQIAVSYLGMLMHPEKEQAMKEALSSHLYAEMRGR